MEDAARLVISTHPLIFENFFRLLILMAFKHGIITYSY